jgi:hypothetical protein
MATTFGGAMIPHDSESAYYCRRGSSDVIAWTGRTVETSGFGVGVNSVLKTRGKKYESTGNTS